LFQKKKRIEKGEGEKEKGQKISPNKNLFKWSRGGSMRGIAIGKYHREGSKKKKWK